MADDTAPAPDAAPDITTLSDDALIDQALADLPDEVPETPETPQAQEPPASQKDAEPAEQQPEAPQEKQGDAEPPKQEGGDDKNDSKEAAKDDGPHERAWSAIRRKEKDLVDQRAEFKREQEAVAIERQQFQKLNDSVREMQAEVRRDPLAFIQRAAGYTMDDLVRMALADDGKPGAAAAAPAQQQGEDPVRKELAELRQLIQSQSEQRVHEQALQEYRGTLKTTLSDPRYELLDAYRVLTPDGGTMDAAGVIEYRASLDAQRGEQILTPQDYADRLLSEYKEDLTSKASHSAVRKALGLTDESTATGSNGSKKRAPQSGPEPTTLTNSLATPRRPKPESLPNFQDEDAVIADALRAMSD